MQYTILSDKRVEKSSAAITRVAGLSSQQLSEERCMDDTIHQLL